MSKFFLKLTISIVIILLFVPQSAGAETTQNPMDEGFMRIKVQLLQMQIELLRIQIALLTEGISAKPAVPVFEMKKCAQLEISWGSVQGATGYRLYRDGNIIYEGWNRSFVDSGLVLGEKYRYVAYGLYHGEEGDPSEVQEITAPDICPPKTPRLISERKPCGGQVTLRWALDSEARVYQLFRGSWEIYSGPLSQFVDSGLTPIRTYEYKIKAGNRGGWSDFLDVVSVQASNVCAPSVPEVSSVVPESSSEGILFVELKSSPSNNIRVRPGETSQSVMAIKVGATHSDISIVRIDLFFASQVWRYLNKIGIQYEGRTVAKEEASRESFTRIGSGDIYRIRFENIQPLVKDGSSGIITIIVDAKEFPQETLPHYITVFLGNNSIRGVDGMGLQQYVPQDGGGKEGNFVRTFRIE
ncbi:MAG: fibronectin type III domain-containing protein [Ignavibacteria bacterium]|nr:fibronectin type III domain-containing protein [Ignavibacteria bacterium]